jgi:hypothetical protein
MYRPPNLRQTRSSDTQALLRFDGRRRPLEPDEERSSFGVLARWDPEGHGLKARYERLCELAHPNHPGFARFLGTPVVRSDGGVTCGMSRENRDATTDAWLVEVASAVGWSSELVCNGFLLVLKALAGVVRRWPDRA